MSWLVRLKRASPRLTFLSELPGDGLELVAAGFWSLVLRGSGMVATFILGVQLARYLGPSDLGLYGLILSSTMLLSAAGQLGLPTLATRKVAVAWRRKNYGVLRGVLHWFGWASFSASCLLAAMFALGSRIWPGLDPRLPEAALIGAPLIPLYALTVLLSAELRAIDRLVLGQSLEILVRPMASSILLAIVFIAASKVDTRGALAVSVVAATIALSIAFVWMVRCLPASARSAKPERDIGGWLRSARPLIFADILRQLDGTYAVILMGFVSTSYQTGIFRVAQSIMLALAIPVFVVQVVVAPTLARLHEAGDLGRLQKVLGFSALATLVGSCVGLALILLTGPGLLGFLFGDSYTASWLPLVVLCLTQVVNGLFGVGFVLLPMAGAERELTLSFAFSVAVGLISAIPLIDRWAATGAAMAAVLGALTNGLLTRYFARRLLGVETTLAGCFVQFRDN